ncbi:tRNA (guanosine(18)-2'-O)-methyltransferase [Linum perenne]
MRACKTLIHHPLPSLHNPLPYFYSSSFNPSLLSFLTTHLPCSSLSLSSRPKHFHPFLTRPSHTSSAAISLESANDDNDPQPEPQMDTVKNLLSNPDNISRLMKMETRKSSSPLDCDGDGKRWFPYLDVFKCGDGNYLSSSQVLEAMAPYIMDERKDKFRNAVNNRTYSVCLVVEGLIDYGNVSAAFRSADALGFQSVHVISRDSSKRYKDNRHVSMGAEKWLDIELWDSAKECFEVLKSRGYRIATTHVGMNAVSVYDMDWSCPTAIVVGNEKRGISDEALELSDLHCSIPMNGMVDSFNVSVAAGILMHHAVCDRTSRLGSHGDLSAEENKILLAEFSLRHNMNAISIVHEYAKRNTSIPVPKL